MARCVRTYGPNAAGCGLLGIVIHFGIKSGNNKWLLTLSSIITVAMAAVIIEYNYWSCPVHDNSLQCVEDNRNCLA